MDAAPSIPPPAATASGGGGNNATTTNNSNPPAPSTATTQHQPPIMIARTPLNVYLKIAIIRNPTDEVICNDPEHPGTKKRVVVSELLDGSLTKVGVKEGEQKNDDDNEEAKIAATTTSNDKPAASSPSSSNGEDEKSNKNDTEGPKKEIPVPTITTVPTYDLDIPPTYNIPTSYVRYIRPTYHETHNETVEYNIDVEDETWWRANKEFGPDAKCKILIDGKEQVQMKEEGGGQKIDANNKDDSNAMEVDQDNTTTQKQYTIQDVILTNPKYYLHSKHSTQYLLKKYQPKLPLLIMERMIDILEKETGFEFTVSLSLAGKVLVKKIPELEAIFGWIDGGVSDDDDDDDEVNDNPLPTLAPPPTLKHVISTIYNYWITKRSKLKKPLLRRYHPVTASNDTNPHMVFRQREQEKRRLRKKRQNDIEAYKKMVVLQHDFEKLRGLCELIVKREEVNGMMVELTNGYFEERLGGWLGTMGGGGSSRSSVGSGAMTLLDKSRIESALDIPKYYDDGPIVKMAKAGKKRKRGGLAGAAGVSQFDSRGPSPVPPLGGVGAASLDAGGLVSHPPLPLAAPPKKVVVAGHDDGYPAPNFLQPLATRESHHNTNWDGATVPILPSYENGMPTISNKRFRHRPRLGRGGRIIIDRVPCVSSTQNPQPHVITYGAPMKRSGYDVATLGADGPNFSMSNSPRRKGAPVAGGESISTDGMGTDAKTAPKKLPAQRLEDLFPKSFLGKDRKLLSRKIEEICARGLMEESRPVAAAATAAPALPKGSAAPVAEEFVDEMLVPIEDWVEAPNGEIFGVERYVLGPI
mmetsp:Transcript_28063/g.56363  ORF Transcript_28063/g.56363 Transcript_28063/m.56363 type:complete len:809 (+) Transcript_28063:2-2428(+)